MDDLALATDSLVVFRNSQGAESRGTLIRLTRNLVVFEVYNPYSIVQLSEVLSDVKIRRGDRTIYTGRAVVSNLLSTGLLLIVSATLVDSWSDLVGLSPGAQLRDEVRNFVADWDQASLRLRPGYELAVSKLRHFLVELSRWLEHGETVAGLHDPNAPPHLVREFVADVEAVALSRIQELFGAWEQEIRKVPTDEVMVHKAFTRHELHAYTLCSPFVHRTYAKPLGYAGDYQMVNMILEDRWKGSNTYAKLINAMFLQSGVSQGHRNRIDMLVARLHGEARRVAAEGRPLLVLNVGCGPAGEVQRFLRETDLADRMHLRLVDFNQETLEFARARIQEAVGGRNVSRTVDLVHQSIHDLLKEAAGRRGPAEIQYDLVYCAGLFDYLSDRVCSRLVQLFYSWTAPGGLLAVTNVTPGNPIRGIMEHLVEWNLTMRDEQDMRALAPDLGQQHAACDATGTNVFLDVRKPAAPLVPS